MKRIIVLLLVLLTINVSYGEELNTEQQQLAWKFMLENLVDKDYLPAIYKYRDSIQINIAGKITSEDSLVVREIINSIKNEIPELKIGLSKQKGKLNLELNNKVSRSSLTSFDNHSIGFKNIFEPAYDSLSNAERKQFIYFQFFRGLVFFKEIKQEIPELKGCVFAEKDFKSITFSPYDLFILKKLYTPDFSIQLAHNLPLELQETAWNNIRLKFLAVSKTPVIYKTDIAVKLKGNISHGDSIIIKEVIDQVKMIIPNRKIYLTPDTGNLILDFDPEPGIVIKTSFKRINNKIIYKDVSFRFPDNITSEERKKTVYYYFTRSLFDLFVATSDQMTIPGSVFDEKTPQNITYTPIDAFVMNKLYADDFNRQFKDQYIWQFSYRLYLVYMYGEALYWIFFVLALLIPSILLIRWMINGAFKPHCWNWKEYNKQGIYLTICYFLFIQISSLSDLQIEFRFFIVLIAFIQALIAINLIYFAERFIFLRRPNVGSSKVFIIYIVTLIGLSIAFSFRMDYNMSSGVINKATSTNIPFPYIILLSLARSIYIYLNDRYKSIINQKDVELAQMGELHKQAELQSLRAKINPHFLYNALNSIASLATTDGHRTEQMALSLSDFFKYAINREQKQLNTLSEELNAIRTYLEIEKVRFGERLNFEIDCPAELLEVQIPQLLIQPLVENAIKHGLSKITDKGFIKISVSQSASLLKIRVYDNGPAFPDGPLSGFGIQNTQERIALIYGSKAGINWQNRPEKYIEITLPVNNK